MNDQDGLAALPLQARWDRSSGGVSCGPDVEHRDEVRVFSVGDADFTAIEEERPIGFEQVSVELPKQVDSGLVYVRYRRV
jgi:hypothetical protein